MGPTPHLTPRYVWPVDIGAPNPYPPSRVASACLGKRLQRSFRPTLTGGVPPKTWCLCLSLSSFYRISPCRIHGVPYPARGVGGRRTGHRKVHPTERYMRVGPSSPLQVGGSPARGDL